MVMVHFVVAEENQREITAYMRVYLGDAPRTNCAVAFDLLGERIMMDQSPSTRVEIEKRLAQLASADPEANTNIGISCSRSTAVQDLITLLDLCQKWHLGSVCLVVPVFSTNASPYKVGD
jgi:hypothetical protein